MVVLVNKEEANSRSNNGAVSPPILLITPPQQSSPTDEFAGGSTTEIHSLTLTAADIEVGLLTSSDSRSYDDLRAKDCGPQSERCTLTLPAANRKSTSLPNQPRGGGSTRCRQSSMRRKRSYRRAVSCSNNSRVPFNNRRLSSNAPQGGAILFNHRRKQKSFDISMLSRDSDELSFLSRGRSPSPCHEDRAIPTGRVDFCDYVVEEILVTEQQYVRDLEDIVEGYLDYSKRCLHITDQDITDIFSNIEDIYNFHISFLKDLESCDDQAVAIAECFTSRGAEFDIYAKYVTNYPSSIASLTLLLRKALVNDAFRKQQLILGHGLPLGSYLHKPVQRILKYHLLLQNMLKHFGEDTVGRETINTALQCMTDCAHNINELKRSHEHAMKIQEIQSTLYNFEGYNLMDFGKLVHEGNLKMHGAKSFRHIYLFEKGVIICKKREDGAMSCKTTIMCHNLMLIESVPREPFSFHLVPFDNPRQQNTFQAKTLEQKREWCNMVKKYMLENFDVRIPEKAKELLLTLTGKSEVDGKTAKHFKAFTLKPHQTPDYIDRRRRSQPFVSVTGGGTLPRTKKRVRKVSAEPMSLLTSPPTTRMSRSMSAPLTPDLLGFATTSSAELNVSNSSVDLNSMHAESNDKSTNCANGPSASIFCDIMEETIADTDVNETLSLDIKNTNVCADTVGFSKQPAIPTLKVTEVDAVDKTNDVEILSTKPQKLVDSKRLHVPCAASLSMPKSAAATSRSSMFSTSAVSTPCLLRRHSLSDLKPVDDKAASEELLEQPISSVKPKSYDELSDRAHVLQRILCERNGFDNPIWSPELASLVRRYRTVLVKRADSYSEAVMQSTRLSPRPQSEASLSYDSGDLLADSSRNSSILSDVSYQDCINEQEHNAVKPSDGGTLRRGKTETSQILNKLTQLKEKTSSKLSDLLKRSPVKLFKDGEPNSQNIEYSEPHGSQSIVGRRLSNSDAIIADGLSVHRPSLPNQSVIDDIFSDSSPTDPVQNSDSLLQIPKPCIPTSDSELTLLAGYPEQSEYLQTKEVQCLDEENNFTSDTAKPPLTYRNRPVSNGIDRDSTISLTSTNGETLERTGSKQGYSSENLADVEENDYENIGYGDHDLIKSAFIANEPIYSTVENVDRVKKVIDEGEDNEIPPALPPLPEFLIKRRLAKTKSCGDVMPIPDVNHNQTSGGQRMSVPNNIRLNTPTSDFWVALEKYMETGEVDSTASAVNHRPIENGITPLRVSQDVTDVEPKEKSETHESESQMVFTPRRKSSSSNYGNNNVLKMARKYSTRIKRREEGQKKLKVAVTKVDEDGTKDDHSTSCTSDGASERKAPPRRVSSIRLRRTNSERIKRFHVILDSDDEYGTKLDSGAPQCDVDSGSDCNDIYEKQTMAALESFASTDEMRDSAIYSDGEDIGVIPLTSPTKFRSTRKTPVRKVNIVGADESEMEPRRCQSFSRSNSLPNRKVGEQIFGSVVDLVSRPVSSSLVVRLEALKYSSTFERENSSDAINKESSVHQLTQNLKDHSTKTFIKQCSVPVVTNNDFALVAERQNQLTKPNRKLVRQQSTDTIPIDPGLVRTVKEKLQAA